jgi:uncharacterized protein (DUF1499 family)
VSESTDSNQIAASEIEVRAPDDSVGSAPNLAPKRSFRRVLRKAGLTLLVLSIVVIALGRLVSSHAVIPSDVGLSADGFLHGCGERKNCVRSIYVEGGGSPPNREAWQASWRYSGDEAAAMDRIVKIVKSYGGEIRIRKPTYLAAVFKSAIFKFPDDVEFSIDPTHDDIAWRSASRLGKADLEVNANRMSALFSEWNKKG